MKHVIHEQFAETHQGRQLDLIVQWGNDSIKIKVYKDQDPHYSQFQTWVWHPVSKEWHPVVIFQPKETAEQMPTYSTLPQDAEVAFRSLAASLLVPTLRVMRKIADIDERGHGIDHFMVAYDLVCEGVDD